MWELKFYIFLFVFICNQIGSLVLTLVGVEAGVEVVEVEEGTNSRGRVPATCPTTGPTVQSLATRPGLSCQHVILWFSGYLVFIFIAQTAQHLTINIRLIITNSESFSLLYFSINILNEWTVRLQKWNNESENIKSLTITALSYRLNQSLHSSVLTYWLIVGFSSRKWKYDVIWSLMIRWRNNSTENVRENCPMEDQDTVLLSEGGLPENVLFFILLTLGGRGVRWAILLLETFH